MDDMKEVFFGLSTIKGVATSIEEKLKSSEYAESRQAVNARALFQAIRNDAYRIEIMLANLEKIYGRQPAESSRPS